ncbi:hypothetical protein FPQ18DRAFT_301119 [Pyronema domesticum]|nr:hypothetical protein FPQ18DRAFT_301119 [Pyronema domesticum]
MDRISVGEEKFILIIETKKSSTGEALKQCLLSLKDARDNSGEGEVYGFVTTGEQWQMIRHDGTSFTMTNKVMATFGTMEEEKEKWMKECSILVDCINVALSNGGIVQKKSVLMGVVA